MLLIRFLEHQLLGEPLFITNPDPDMTHFRPSIYRRQVWHGAFLRYSKQFDEYTWTNSMIRNAPKNWTIRLDNIDCVLGENCPLCKLHIFLPSILPEIFTNSTTGQHHFFE